MPPKLRSQKNKVIEYIPPTVASTSGTSGITAQGRGAEIFENAPPLRTELSSGLEGIRLGSSSTLYKIWVRYGDNQPAKIVFDGEDVDDLKEALKKKLSPKLNDVAIDDITLRRHGEEADLRADLTVDESFVNTYDTPLQVIVNAPATLKRKREEPPEDLHKIMESVAESAVEKVLSQQRHETIQASNLSETKARTIMDSFKLMDFKLSAEDFQPISPINYQPFVWDTETDEAHQMPEVEKWFKKALDLPRGFYVKDVHTQIQERHLKSSNITLRGGTDISIGASDNDCVWIETKKKKEDFKEGQVIGELFIVDNRSATKSMSVLTDCNDNWTIYFFMKTENHQYLASSKINDRSIALAIIKQFVLDEGIFIHGIIGKHITYQDQINLPEPLKKKSRLEPISEEVDDRMADLIDDMTEKELFNMSMRKRLRLAKSFVRIEEQPAIDQLIRQFSDDYEDPPPMMFT